MASSGGNAAEDEREDGMGGNLAAEGVEGGEDFIAGGAAGVGGEQDSIGELRENEGVGVEGGGAVDDDEAEFLTPARKERGHAGRGDELGGTGWAGSGVKDGKQRRRGGGVGVCGSAVAGEQIGEARVRGKCAGGRGTEVGIDAEHGGAMLSEDCGQAESEGG